MNTDLIVVLDVDTHGEALDTVAACGNCTWFKVGSQLFTRCGPAVVRDILAKDRRVFLDLKFHDIPNTVAQAASAAAALGVDLFTIHATGGQKMIAAAPPIQVPLGCTTVPPDPDLFGDGNGTSEGCAMDNTPTETIPSAEQVPGGVQTAPVLMYTQSPCARNIVYLNSPLPDDVETLAGQDLDFFNLMFGPYAEQTRAANAAGRHKTTSVPPQRVSAETLWAKSLRAATGIGHPPAHASAGPCRRMPASGLPPIT